MKFFRKTTSKPTQTELSKTANPFQAAQQLVKDGRDAVKTTKEYNLTKGQQVVLVGLQTEREQAGLWR